MNFWRITTLTVFVLTLAWMFFNVFRLANGDLNLDGKVDIEDLSIMADNFEGVE